MGKIQICNFNMYCVMSVVKDFINIVQVDKRWPGNSQVTESFSSVMVIN